ncbi:MAG TPA: hypothetical protein VLV45_15380 [Gemmatimonadales bacterium]|nr:hypothetical protein [Gemmatimonadales bacterium]
MFLTIHIVKSQAPLNAGLSNPNNHALAVGPQPQIVGANLDDVADCMIARYGALTTKTSPADYLG